MLRPAIELVYAIGVHKFMEFVESQIFEKQVSALLSDDEFALFQGFLFSNPKAGAVIQQTGGLRKGSTMDKKLFDDLVESMQQHNEVIAGTRKPARVTKVDAQSIKVLRARAGLTQEKFAALIQVDLSTLRNWEQGRREPTGPAKALIRAITNDPKHVLKALEVRATMRKAG
jgi:putative transcriptional regulator